jgi:hypothetical protein
LTRTGGERAKGRKLADLWLRPKRQQDPHRLSHFGRNDGAASAPRNVRFHHRHFAHIALGIFLTALVLGCAACGGDPNASVTTTTAPASIVHTNTPTSVTSSTTATVPAQTVSASGTVGDSAGDFADVQVTLRQAVPADEITDAAVRDCSPYLDSAGSSLARSAAIEITIVTTVTSSSNVSFNVNMLTDMDVATGGTAQTVGEGDLDGHALLWATTYTDSGPQCDEASDGDLGTWAAEQVTNQAPNTPSTWTSYLIVPEVVTPASPPLSSSQNPVNALLFHPVVNLASTSGSRRIAFQSSQPDVVVCSPDENGSVSFVALDPVEAQTLGCQPQ